MRQAVAFTGIPGAPLEVKISLQQPAHIPKTQFVALRIRLQADRRPVLETPSDPTLVQSHFGLNESSLASVQLAVPITWPK